MRNQLAFLASFLLIVGCTNIIEEDLTGNEVTYPLRAGTSLGISGTVTLKEKKDGSAAVFVRITKIVDNLPHPIHLHRGSTKTSGEILATLNPIEPNTGISITYLKILADQSPVTYSDLITLDGSIRIHKAQLESGGDFTPAKIILSAGNIGQAFINSPDDNSSISICD